MTQAIHQALTAAEMSKRLQELEAHTHALGVFLMLLSNKLPSIKEELTQYGAFLETHPGLPPMDLAQALRTMKFLGAEV